MIIPDSSDPVAAAITAAAAGIYLALAPQALPSPSLTININGSNWQKVGANGRDRQRQGQDGATRSRL